MGAMPRLGQGNLRAARDAADRRLRGHRKFDGIYLARHKGKELLYAGKVDHGFDAASAKDLQTRLKPLIRKTQPYARKIAHRGICRTRAVGRDRIPRQIG